MCFDDIDGFMREGGYSYTGMRDDVDGNREDRGILEEFFSQT